MLFYTERATHPLLAAAQRNFCIILTMSFKGEALSSQFSDVSSQRSTIQMDAQIMIQSFLNHAFALPLTQKWLQISPTLNERAAKSAAQRITAKAAASTVSFINVDIWIVVCLKPQRVHCTVGHKWKKSTMKNIASFHSFYGRRNSLMCQNTKTEFFPFKTNLCDCILYIELFFRFQSTANSLLANVKMSKKKVSRL